MTATRTRDQRQRYEHPREPDARRPRPEADRHWVDLWQRCALSDCEASWAELVERAAPWLALRVRNELGRLPSRALAGVCEADVIQDVYVRLLQMDRRILRRSHFRHDGQVRRYLAQMVRSRVIDLVRSQNRLAHRTADGVAHAHESYVCEGPSPYRVASGRDELRRLRRALRDVAAVRREPERTERVLKRIWLDQWTVGEAARAEGLSPHCAHTLHYRCRLALKKRLAAPDPSGPTRSEVGETRAEEDGS